MGNASEELGKVLNPKRTGVEGLMQAGKHNLDQAIGLESRFGRTMTGAMSGMANEIDSGVSKFHENLDRSDLNVANWKQSEEKPGAQASSANYTTGASGTSRKSSSGGKKGTLATDKKKGNKGKKALKIKGPK